MFNAATARNTANHQIDINMENIYASIKEATLNGKFNVSFSFDETSDTHTHVNRLSEIGYTVTRNLVDKTKILVEW